MAVKLNTGDLKHRVVFKQPTSSLNDELGEERTYATAFTVWAAVRNFNQFRTTEANATELIGSLDFYVRYSSQVENVTKDWLLEYKAEDYTIHEIENVDQENVFFRFTAKVRTNG
jgi:SPP1 family predicted phage head-tail adaptor